MQEKNQKKDNVILQPSNITLRQHFASMAITGVIDGSSGISVSNVAKRCVMIADALLKELDNE